MKRRPSAAMGRPYTALHKNLAELESIVYQLREADPDVAFKRQTICGEMAGKIDFVKALLAAEKEVHAAGLPPPHILHLTERLRTVEEALRDCDGESSVLPAEEDELRHASMCSCTDECFEEEEEPEPEPEKEEEEDDDDGRVPEPEDFGTIMYDNLEESEGWSGTTTDEGNGETQPSAAGRCCQCRCISTAGRQCLWIGVAVAMVGAVAVGTWAATNLYSVEEFLLVPT